MLWTLLSAFVEVCTLRRSPADLPASSTLAIITTALFALLSCASEWLTPEPSHFPARPALSLVTSFALVAAVLQFAGYRERIKQTWIAFTGCGALISMVVFPLALSMSPRGDEPTATFPLTALAILFLLVWSIVVDAHIYRHAIHVPLYVGIAISALTFTALLLVRTALFP